jgi:UDP-N-acetyl-D-mannosaminuronic acid dehydrogenase
MIVSVIGAGGHVGLPFALVCANAGHKVYGIDVNENTVSMLNSGVIPYIEHGAKELLEDQIGKQNIKFTVNPTHIKESDVVAIMLGTPVDHENNPRLDDLFDFIDNTLTPFMKHGQLIILRSTVSPGTTELVRDRIELKTKFMEGVDFHLVFCPERVVQTRSVEETGKLPQLVGAFNLASYNKAVDFNASYNKSEQFFLTPREAELGKLMTNMYRYVTFALANEFWMIGEKQGVNVDKITKAINFNYPRMDLPLPGPNVGGPCLFKDGRFLLSDIPFGDLIQTGFLINEGMPDYIFNRIKSYAGNTKIKKVLILGASFKKHCDDTRNSLSFKMRKVCKKNGAETFMDDPYVSDSVLGYQKMFDIKDYDAVVVMTPHDTFLQTYPIKSFREDCIIADIWKLYPESEMSNSGIYRVGDFK